MQIRTFLGILAALALVAALAVLGSINQPLLDRPFHLTPQRTVPLWTALLAIYVAGVLSFAGAFLLRGSAGMIERWKGLQGARSGRAVDELFGKGMDAVLDGREERALEHFQAILARDPDHFQALLKAGAVLRSLRRVSEAVEMHKKAHRLQDHEMEPLFELVKDYEALEQIGKAKVVLGRIIQLRPRRALSAYRKLRSFAMQEGDWARAWELQGLIEHQMEKTESRKDSERRYSTGIRYEMACAAARDGRDRDALNGLRKMTRSDPQFAPAYLKLGEILRGQGQSEAALKVWASGFQQTASPVFLKAMEDHFLAEEDPEGAISALQEVAAMARRDFLPRFYLGRLYLRLEMIDEAYSELRQLAVRASESAIVQSSLALAQERRGELREAASSYRRVLERLDQLKVQYRCGHCQQTHVEWVDRCPHCGEWNQVGLSFGEDPTLEDLGLSPGPVYSRTA